jgi:3-deoxy-D-manno-octulosonic acid (KDO) 8-phosphate synthase
MYEEPINFPPTILCVDNSAAVTMSTNAKLTKKTRHIARHFHFVREGVKRGLHSLKWITNKIQLADVLTKTQPASKTNPQVEKFMFQLPDFLIRQTTKGETQATTKTPT